MASEASNATIAEMAAQRVAAGMAGSTESATWSVTYSVGYQHATYDARNRKLPARCHRGLQGRVRTRIPVGHRSPGNARYVACVRSRAAASSSRVRGPGRA
jgi:hypothetical protein